MKRTIFSTVLRYASLGCAVLAAILQAVAIATNYGYWANYFHAGSILPLISVFIAILAWVLGILSVFPKKSPDTNPSPISQTLLPSLPACIGFVVSAFGILSTGVSTTTLLVATALFIAAIYCIFSVLPKSPLLGCFAVLGCALLNARYYFDMSVEMNAPLKVTLQTALLFSMIYYTTEMRFLLNRGMPRLYAITAYATVASCALAAFSVPLAYFTGKLEKLDYATGGILALGIAITVSLRIYHFYAEDPSRAENNDCTEENPE